MNKYKRTMIVSALLAVTLTLAGCNASETIKTVIQNSYSVVVQATKAVAVIQSAVKDVPQLQSSMVYVDSLTKAMGALQTTMEKVAPLVGANLTTLSSASPATSTAELDAATAKLLGSIK